MVFGDLDSYMQKTQKLDHQLNTIHKNKLKMYKRLKYESQHHRGPRGELRQENLRYLTQ